jgi:hypothetical protein
MGQRRPCEGGVGGSSQRKNRGPNLPAIPRGVVDLLQTCFGAESIRRSTGMHQVIGELRSVYLEETGQEYSRSPSIAISPDSDNLNNRALSFLDLGKRPAALESWNEALKLSPHHPEAAYNSALVGWRSGEISDNDAVAIVTACCSTDTSGAAVHLLGRLHLERGDRAQALSAFDEAGRLGVQPDQLAPFVELARSEASGASNVTGFVHEHMRTVNSLTGTEDGLVLSASDDGTVRLWDLERRECLSVLRGHRGPVETAILDPAGRRALSGRADGLVRVWDVRVGKAVGEWPGHIGMVRALTARSDFTRAYSGGDDRAVRWDVSNGQNQAWQGHGGPVRCLALSADGRWLASGSEDATVRLWNTMSQSCVRVFEGHRKDITSVDVNRDGTLMATGSWDKTAKVF